MVLHKVYCVALLGVEPGIMYLVAGFESNVYLEMALSELHESEIEEKDIVVVSMEAQKPPQTLFDSIHYSDGVSILDGMAAWAVVGGVFGIVYGSQLKYGPLALGIAGFVVGASIGFTIDLLVGRRKKKWNRPTRSIEILLLIHCKSKEQMKNASTVCQKYHVISLGVHPV